MKKSLSCSSINNIGVSQSSISSSMSSIQSIKKSTSMNALPIHNIEHNLIHPIELLIFTNYPINKLVSCSIDNYKFPDEILDITKKSDKNYLDCMLSPCDIQEEAPEKINLSLSRTYLQLSIESSEQQERYSKWLSRIRRKNNKFISN
jgi:hypothetical protein